MAHIHEKIDFTASVYIVFKNKVLLHKHKKLGIWLQPGGHIELDEGPIEAALREVKEETGLDVQLVGSTTVYNSSYGAQDLPLPRFLNRHYFDAPLNTHEHIDFGYFARAKSDTVQHEIPGGEIRWFSREELERNEEGVLEEIRAHALAALSELSE